MIKNCLKVNIIILTDYDLITYYHTNRNKTVVEQQRTLYIKKTNNSVTHYSLLLNQKLKQ